MKKLSIYIFAFVALFSLGACDNYLDQESPDQPTTDQVWQSYEAAEKYLASAYSYISANGWRYHEYYYLPQNFRADDLFPENGTTAWSYLARIVGFNNTASDGVPSELWTNWYKGVKLANDVIANVPEMEMLSEDEKNELVAEAKYLRGFYFLNLQMNFHAIIMPVTVAESSEDLQLGTSTKQQVFDQVVEDLAFAAQHLPSDWDADQWGRATKHAANAFLGKAHLYMGDYQNAVEAFNKISGHDLVDGDQYRGMFDGTLEQNIEVLFSRGYTEEQMDALGLYHQIGVAMAPGDLQGGWNMASVSNYFMNQLEAGDVRKAASVLEHGEEFDGQTIEFLNPEFKMSIKYVESLESISINRSVVDIILMRYADVLLMQAEANYELGNEGVALNLVNRIRNRAGLANSNASGTDLRDEIRKQRMIELIGENSRYYDLVRWGIVKEQLEMAQQPYAQNHEEKHNFFPIPLEEVQRNPNVEPTPGF
ncbi:RagB/SusD family nutrient uptake outer membrane protein [Flammeovirga sp. SubArs3]|uniref:RagB/SusD family nutrient uptake outer membrane protein n=1 Tax=Flammeovirga sp. SubArs3 TaxID=2995316 RepID=UPI00248C6D9E|nr:RagB/SusD family nutrient uptake outer membrane protein [Flammeovirga sp. SubArs3]